MASMKTSSERSERNGCGHQWSGRGMNHAMAADAPRNYGPNQRRRTAMILWLGVVSANLIGLFAAVYVSSYLRAGAGDPDILFIFYYGALLLAGVADALWIDEAVFKGAFRRTIQGRTTTSKNADVEDVAAGMQPSTMRFPIVVLLCCGLTYLLFNLVNHRFDRWWQDIGEHTYTLRSPKSGTAEQQQSIIALSTRPNPEVLDVLEEQLQDGDPVVEAYAAWAIGRQKKHETMNMNRVPALVERVRNGDPKVRREALLALARLQHQAIADEVQADLAAELDAGVTIDLRLIWGLGYLQHADSLPVLDKALYHPDETVQRLAAWSLSQHRDSGKGRAAADLLEQRLPAASMPTKCAIVQSLGVLADERSNLALMHAYQTATADERQFFCKRLSVSASPDGERDHEDLLAPSDRFGIKIMQSAGAMRATSPEIREQIEPWLESVIAAADTPLPTRESAQSLLAGIREQRNDIQ
jgi:hypothetical protein